MIAKRLRVGIIGVGTIGRFHLEAAKRLGAVIAAVAGNRADHAAALTQELGIPAFTDYRQMLADPTIDIVHICTPDNLHYQMASEAIRAGKHVICEKPLTLTLGESADLLHQAEELRRVHAIGFNNRFYPLIQEMRARVDRGDLGRIFGVRGFILEDSLLFDTVYDWRLDPKTGGNSCAMSTIGSHLLDLTSFVVGFPITAVCADFTTVHRLRHRAADWNENRGMSRANDEIEIQSEEVANVLVRFASGARGVLGVSRAAAGRRYKIVLEVDGTEAAAVWDSETSNQLWQGHGNRPNQIILRDPQLLTDSARPFATYPGAYSEGFADTIKSLVQRVYRRIVAESDGSPDFPTFADGYAAQLVHEAVVASARTDKWVEVAPVANISRS